MQFIIPHSPFIAYEAGERSIRMLLKIPKQNRSGKGESAADPVTPKPADRLMNFLFFLYETSRPRVYMDELSKIKPTAFIIVRTYT